MQRKIKPVDHTSTAPPKITSLEELNRRMQDLTAEYRRLPFDDRRGDSIINELWRLADLRQSIEKKISRATAVMAEAVSLEMVNQVDR